jgi:hypothetical protein
MLVVKIKYGEDTRRITIDYTPRFVDLSKMLRQLFGSIGSTFVIKYLDDEGDLVSLSSDLELKEALSVSTKQTTQVLRLFAFGTVPTNLFLTHCFRWNQT